MAGVTRQQAALELAKLNRDRLNEAVKVKAVSASERDQAVTKAKVAEAALQSAEAQLESDRKAIAVADAGVQQAKATMQTARINLGYTRVTAPISGRIGKSSVTDGALVTAYQPRVLATIQQLDPIYVDVPQSTTELRHLQKRLKDGRLRHNGADQSKVKLILEEGMTYPHKGILQFQDVTVDPTTGSVILRIVFPNPQGILLPGMFVRTIVTEGINDRAILVPQQGVARNPKGEPIAMIVDADNKVQQRLLTLDRAIGNKWLVSSGLNSGDRLIVEGLQKVRPGSSVKVIPFEPDNNGQVSAAMVENKD